MTLTDAIPLVLVVVIAILVAMIWAVIRRMDARDTQFGRIEGQYTSRHIVRGSAPGGFDGGRFEACRY